MNASNSILIDAEVIRPRYEYAVPILKTKRVKVGMDAFDKKCDNEIPTRNPFLYRITKDATMDGSVNIKTYTSI